MESAIIAMIIIVSILGTGLILSIPITVFFFYMRTKYDVDMNSKV